MADENVAQPSRPCTKCGEIKPATRQYFHRDSNGQFGLKGRCIACVKARDADRWKRVATPERLAADRQRQAAWREANREWHNERAAIWRISNRDKDRASSRRWGVNNPARKLANNRASMKRRKRVDPVFAINVRISVGVRRMACRTKAARKWSDLLGYTADDLRRHIERQFTRGMTWATFLKGKIHIDHIVPLSSFRFSSVDDPEFRAAWALTNLRPLWAVANIAKGAKRTHLL